MLLAACVFVLAPPFGQAAGTEIDPRAPRLDVLAGKVRVFASDSWRTLPAGTVLSETSVRRLSLDAGSRARWTFDGAGAELRGPLEVDAEFLRGWTLRLEGAGKVELDVRRAALKVELDSAARLDLDAGVYWAEGVPGGGWRVGCEGGAPLILRPPAGTGWRSAPRVAGGSSLRILPARMVLPSVQGAAREPAQPPWKNFSWPWTKTPQRPPS